LGLGASPLGPFIPFAVTTRVGPSSHWIVASVYIWLAMVCVWSWREDRGLGGRIGSWARSGLAAIFATLAVGRVFGLQWRLAEFFRRRAVVGGWYDERRGFQTWVVLAVAALAAAVVIAIVAVSLRRKSPRTLAVFAPVATLLGFLAVRAVSLHQIDHLLYRRVAGVEVNLAVELTLLALVAAGLIWGPIRAPTSIVARDDERGARHYTIR